MTLVLPRLQQRPARIKTPTVLQMEAVECGAAALGIILAHYKKFVPLAELRQSCSVSRDGVTAANVLKAARRYGMMAKGFKKSLDRVQELTPPFIVFWHFNHFLVVEGFSRDRVFLNDPATGPRTVTLAEFDEGYTGIALVVEPGEEFAPSGQSPSVLAALQRRLKSSPGAILLTVATGLLLVVPNILLPALSQIFIDGVLVARRFSWLPYVLLTLAVIVVLQGYLTVLQLRYLRSLKLKLSISMTSRFMWHVLRLPVDFYTQRYPGEIASRIRLNDQVANALSGRLATTVVSLVVTVFYGMIMLLYDPVLTAIVVGLAGVNILVLQWVARRRADANLRLAQEYGKVDGVAIAGLQSIETLKAAGIESDFFARWSGYYTKAVNVQQGLSATNQLVGLLPTLLSMLTMLAILVIGGWRVIHGSLTIGMLVAFQLLAQSFQAPVNQLVQFSTTLQTLYGSLQRLDDVLDNQVDSLLQAPLGDVASGHIPNVQTGSLALTLNPSPNIGRGTLKVLNLLPFSHNWEKGLGDEGHLQKRDAPVASSLPTTDQANPPALTRLQGYIDIQNLTFGYSRLNPPLIENFNLSIRPGQRIALVGGSGSGKSTLARVIVGLYQPWSGHIYFDGIPQADLPATVRTTAIAFVEQEILLFAGTLRDNLTLWNSAIPMADIQQAVRDAEIESAVLALPCGYDAELLEGAVNLSGGQRQRLEIARALVNNPSILVLDEATSALDTETERRIDRNLRRRGCTCIIVAHRLSTIRDADEIIVLDQGQVVQRGTHDQLKHQPGAYAHLIQSEGGS